VGVSRSPLSNEGSRGSLLTGVHGVVGLRPSQRQDFSCRIFYAAGVVASALRLETLTKGLSELDEASPGENHRSYYPALAPALYDPAVSALGDSGQAVEIGGWRGVVIEKPLGVNLASTQKLNPVGYSVFWSTRCSGPLGVQRKPGLPHRPLSGQGTGAEPAGFHFANTILNPCGTGTTSTMFSSK
jgi:glucose-6-phosphate 1-dehydrogenase